MAYSWKVLANDWSTLSDTDKEALFVGTNYNKPKAEAIVDTENSGFDLKLPGEVEKRTVTVDEVDKSALFYDVAAV